MLFRSQGLDRRILSLLDIDSRGSDFTEWVEMVEVLRQPPREVEVALVGKYIELQDAYKSKYEALTHGGVANNVRVNVNWLDSEIFEGEGAIHHLENVHGILVPEGEISKAAGTTWRGTDETRLARAARRFGCDLPMIRKLDPAKARRELVEYLRGDIPCLICVEGWKIGRAHV